MFSKFKYLIYVSCLSSAPYVQGGESNMAADSVRAPHELRGVEVLGVKQMPQAGALPVTKLNQAPSTALELTPSKI